ncbi:hypothetical protein RSOLAG22IIIB_05651 [Rhizoctonia solani]|uniref:Endonuclease/exonuclease/phosphatase domain-containing protein n=1 Tax=Rhizoctonia solani TaxID=456999 RepID=A0A0K6G8J9_9AGAM|nr:hypothetical protein RSOLAG22IIIB_05651 [Rhizoctonia solani]
MALPRDLPTLQSTSSKNYTRPDNVFVSAHLLESLVSCDTAPASHPPCTDHFPIATVLDVTIPEAPQVIKPNFKKTGWPLLRQALKEFEGTRKLPGLRRINNQDKLDERVESLTETIYEAVRASTPNLKLCAWTKRWWTNELKYHRKVTRALTLKSYKARSNKDDCDAKQKHLEEFLEELDEETMWTAAKYLNAEPSDGGRACVPKYLGLDGILATASDNETKSRVLMEAFFPPAPPPPDAGPTQS